MLREPYTYTVLRAIRRSATLASLWARAQVKRGVPFQTALEERAHECLKEYPGHLQVPFDIEVFPTGALMVLEVLQEARDEQSRKAAEDALVKARQQALKEEVADRTADLNKAEQAEAAFKQTPSQGVLADTSTPNKELSPAEQRLLAMEPRFFRVALALGLTFEGFVYSAPWLEFMGIGTNQLGAALLADPLSVLAAVGFGIVCGLVVFLAWYKAIKTIATLYRDEYDSLPQGALLVGLVVILLGGCTLAAWDVGVLRNHMALSALQLVGMEATDSGMWQGLMSLFAMLIPGVTAFVFERLEEQKFLRDKQRPKQVRSPRQVQEAELAERVRQAKQALERAKAHLRGLDESRLQEELQRAEREEQDRQAEIAFRRDIIAALSKDVTAYFRYGYRHCNDLFPKEPFIIRLSSTARRDDHDAKLNTKPLVSNGTAYTIAAPSYGYVSSTLNPDPKEIQ